VRAVALPDPGGAITASDLSRNTAQVAVDVSNADVENLVLAFTPAFSIKGRIDLEGAPLSSIPDFERTRLFLFPIEPGAGGLVLAPQTVKPDGTFTLDAVQPGDYRLQLTPTPPNTYMKVARLGSVDVLGGARLQDLFPNRSRFYSALRRGKSM
jgi:hypothetical protein